MVRIVKTYEECVNLGNYQTCRIGLKLHSDKDLTTPEDIKKASNLLLEMAKKIVKEEAEQIKKERGVTNE